LRLRLRLGVMQEQGRYQGFQPVEEEVDGLGVFGSEG